MSHINKQQQADLAADAYNTRTVTKDWEDSMSYRWKLLQSLGRPQQPCNRLPRHGVPRCPNQ